MKEQINLLKQAAEEITSLRRQNELMNARLHMFDSMMSIFNTYPSDGPMKGMAEDVLWKIEKHIDQREKEDNVGAVTGYNASVKVPGRCEGDDFPQSSQVIPHE